MTAVAAARRLLLLCAGLVVMVWTIYLISSPIKYALGFVLLIITFVAGELLLSEHGSQTSINTDSKSTRFGHIIGELAPALAVLASLALVYFVPSIKGELLVPWTDLGPLSILRLAAAFALNFLPGYLILSIFGKRAQIHGLARLLAAYFVTLFVMTIVGFVAAYIMGTIDNFFVTVFVSVNMALIVVRCGQILYSRIRSISFDEPILIQKSKFVLLPALLLVFTVIFKYVWFAGMFEKTGFFIGGPGSDMWRHHGFFESFLDGRAFVWLHIPWWFYVYLASFTVLAGVPSVNAYLSLYPLVILSIFSFYVMVSALFKNRRIGAIAALSYTAFSGFAWLYAFYSRGFGPAVDQASWTRILYDTGGKFLYQGWYPPFTIGFVPADVAYTGLWFVIFATYRLNTRSTFGVFIISVVSSMCYLIHGADLVIFSLFSAALLVVYLLTRNDIGKKRIRWSSVAVLFGLVIVAIIDLSLARYYDSPIYKMFQPQTPFYYFNSPSFQVSLAATVGILILSFVRTKPAVQRLVLKLPKATDYSLAIAGFAVYGAAVVFWIYNLSSISMSGNPYQTAALGSVPWYIYPGVGGILFILALTAACYLVLRWRKLGSGLRDALAFCCFAIVLFYLLGRVVSFVNENFFYTGIWERRMISYIYPVAGMLAAFALVTFFEHATFSSLHAAPSHLNLSSRLNGARRLLSLKKMGKLLAASLLLSLIILGSVSSTLIAQDFIYNTQRSPAMTDAELQALTYLRYSLPLGARIAYLDRSSGTDFIRGFVNDKWTYDASQLWGRSLLSIISSLAGLGIDYIYFHRERDADVLSKNPFLQLLFIGLPIVFNNSDVTIYSVAPLRRPSSSSSLGLISLDDAEGASYDAYALWLSTLMKGTSPYSVISDSSSSQVLTSSHIILTYDPVFFEEATLLNWVSAGGNLIVSNTNPYGISADLFGLMPKTLLVSCDSADSWRTFYNRGTISVENSTKLEGTGSLRLQNNQPKWEEWIYEPSEPWDLSQQKYLGISVYGTGGGPLWYLYLTDSNGSRAFFRYDISTFDYQTKTYEPRFVGWKQHLISIADYYGGLNLTSVKELRILIGYQLPVNMLIDDVFALKETGEGRRAVVANGISADGFMSMNFTDVEVENFSFSSDAEIIANYTKDGAFVAPLALRRIYGNGTLTYLNVNLLYQSIISERTQFAAPHEILARILEIASAERP